ncbi:ABC transporter permease [Bacillus pseudomycoides]|uniref:ABC transporter permease n=1 Tax=Bacillus pseudomycoides TaxID=64104 RepID=UPI000BF038B6|nr:ABC transporter permease [Bacillus pseudomycoides]MED1623832.1 ABC transporter permease [Bacillus pseudomycoides]PEO43621.1 ABC transporter permease [Bacillus pseudomycoides]PHC33006.1 ABC transporter permease [Bacillus pseudomycoides]
MTFSMRRVSAILRKEMQDLKNNAQILLMAILPLGLALFYKQMGQGKEFMGGFVIVMILCMVTTISQATLIAEEKEKHTLRVLMLSPASPFEIIIGKALPIIVLTLAISFLNLFILDVLQGNMLFMFLLVLLGTLVFIIFGTIIALLAKNLVQVSVIASPVAMVLLMTPVLSNVIKNDILKNILSYLPTNHIFEAFVSVVAGKGFSAIAANLINVSIWLVISIIVCLFVYKKKQLD